MAGHYLGGRRRHLGPDRFDFFTGKHEMESNPTDPFTAADGHSARPLVLYIGGSGRSGSTVLESLLAEVPSAVALGEVAHLWERGLRLDELCACGVPFSSCGFWREVGAVGFGGWHNVDLARVEHLKDAVDRQRRMPRTAPRRPRPRVHAQAVEYADYYRRIYDAAQKVSGASVVIDSSKVAPTALALSHHPGIDLRVLHIVRDSRGVAYSWSKHVARPETHGAEEMPRLSAAASTQLWLSHNLALTLVGRRGVPLVRIRYEDLMSDIVGTVQDAWDRLSLPGTPELPMIDGRTIELGETHSVAGNPMRFRRGTTTLKHDTEWRAAMPAFRRWSVTAMSFPVLAHYGYLRGESNPGSPPAHGP